MILKVLFLSLILLAGLACSGKKHGPEPLYTALEFDTLLSSTGAIPDKGNNSAINFSDYSPGVNKLTSRPMSYQRLSFNVLEFETVKQARDEAMRLNQYYARNYLFDKVEGEPILEDMVLVVFHAENPKRRIQRKPVNAPAAHAAPAGGSAAGH